MRVAVDGTEVTSWELDATSGTLHFTTPPAAGGIVTAGFEFDVPVRFDTDLIQVSMASFAAGEIPKIPVIEVRI